MDKVTISFFASNRKDSTEKMEHEGWMSLAVGDAKHESVVPISDRKPAIRAAAWIESHAKVEYFPGLVLWEPLDTKVSDDSGLGYISTTFKATKKANVPTPSNADYPAGWALLKVRNGRFSFDKPRQQYLDVENVDEKADEWGKKIDYVDLLTQGEVLFVYLGNPEKRTDIIPYVKQILNNLALPAGERAEGKRHAVIGGHLRKTIYQITREINGPQSATDNLPVDGEPEAMEQPKYPAKVIDKHGKEVVIDLAKIKGMAMFELLENGKLVTGYQVPWSDDPRLSGPRSTVIQILKDPHMMLRGQVDKDWIVAQ